MGEIDFGSPKFRLVKQKAFGIEFTHPNHGVMKPITMHRSATASRNSTR